jgi:hypothetical protein
MFGRMENISDFIGRAQQSCALDGPCDRFCLMEFGCISYSFRKAKRVKGRLKEALSLPL